MADVGEALAGPFDKYLSPYDLMRREPVDDQRDTPWPWYPFEGEERFPSNVSETLPKMEQRAWDEIPNISPLTPLSVAAGAGDVRPHTEEELIRFLLGVDALNPDPPERPRHVPSPYEVPLPRRRPDNAG